MGSSPRGWWRELDYGIIAYVPEVGPVWSYERLGVGVGEPLSIGVIDLTLLLTGTLH